MQNTKKVLLLLLVLTPSIFFLSKAFSGNSASVEEGKLTVTGAGGFQLPLSEIDSLAITDSLPTLAGTGGFSLGWIKKGKFIRRADGKEIRVIRNDQSQFLYLQQGEQEVYLSLDSPVETEALQAEIRSAQIQ